MALVAGALATGGTFALPAVQPVVAAEGAAQTCNIPAKLARLDYPLSRTARRIAAGQGLTIVALGSSSTQGAGASSPAKTYPSQLAVYLQRRFPTLPITVFNRGVGGEEAGDMLARMDRDVLSAKPDLVIWQIGTNSVLRDRPLPPHAQLISRGLKRFKELGLDVVLIDPQFAPKVITKGETEGMLELIARAAKEHNVDLFHRFDLMRRWQQTDGLAFVNFVSPDGLHMNDWSYACVAKVLGTAIAEAATRPIESASAKTPGH